MQRDTQPLALIVGGSSGMGLATAKLLLARHLRTVLVGNMAAKLEAAQRELSSMGPVEVLQANLYEPRDVARIVAFVQDHTRHIKHLVNAAGYFKPTPFLDHTGEDYDTYLDLNRALFFISQAVAKNMAANGGGSIVHIGSMWARQAIKATPPRPIQWRKPGCTPSRNIWQWNWPTTTFESTPSLRRWSRRLFISPSLIRRKLTRHSLHSMAFIPSVESAQRKTWHKSSTSCSVITPNG